jgi:NADH-quinone oxidoreductase subunit L
MTMDLQIILPILFPLVGVLVNSFFGRRLGERGSGAFASLMVALSFGATVLLLGQLSALPHGEGAHGEGAHGLTTQLFSWIQVGSLSVPFGFQVDQLSILLMLVITGVGLLIHIYATGYMHNDERFPRFFVFLNLFISSMLVLVMGDSFLMMFVGWELVGLCSYLLIGFWFSEIKNSEAGRKAFVVNRIGDVAFVLGILLIFVTFGSLTYTDVFKAVAEKGAEVTGAIGLITLLLFIGATGKSAQLPLMVWLPDAMAGPTPVSALIHAATMVTAGIYMMARSHAMFVLAPDTQMVVGIVGGLTALVAGVIALTQWDIKKVLAYSTVSQLGFMVAACGVGAYVAAVFHLLTHAFFKALLFLGSGSVIHGIEHNPKSATHATPGHGSHHHGIDPQDMRNMGGLKSRMKITFVTYLIGGLALAGVPPFAGFWSKDEILVSAFKGNPIVFWLLAVTAVLTAFYTMRQIRLVFFGEPRSKEAFHTLESGPQMTIPLVILAIFSVVGGVAINWPFEAVLPAHALSHWLEPIVGKEVVVFDVTKAAIFTLLALGAMAAAYFLYRNSYNEKVQREPLEKLGPLYALSSNKFYLDQIYRALVVIPFHGAATVLAQVIDKNGIDAVVNGIGVAVRNAAASLRDIQTGFVRSYGLVMLLGVAVLVAWFVFTR